MNQFKFVLVVLFALLVTGCGSDMQFFEQLDNNVGVGIDTDGDSIPDSQDPDDDNDGILDSDDQWPLDAAKPVTSSLWGAYGEVWDPAGRLPFVAMAGYHEGKDALPQITRIVANVLDFGATSSENSTDDTQAFLDAIEYAQTRVSKENPGAVFVPAGVYEVNQQLHLSGSGMVLQGEDQNTTIIRFPSAMAVDSPKFNGSNRFIVLGGAQNNNGDDSIDSGWIHNKWDNTHSAELDLLQLPKRGEQIIKLAAPLSTELKQKINEQANRMRLSQVLQWSDNSLTPKLAEFIFGGPDYSPPGASGTTKITQEFIVEIGDDDQTLYLDRPLRFSPSDEIMWNNGPLISVKNPDADFAGEEIGVENLSIEFPSTDWSGHHGTNQQDGIILYSNHSWVNKIRLLNADNAIITVSGTNNNEIANVILESDRKNGTWGWGSLANENYYVYGHVGLGIKGRDHVLRDFDITNTSYIHDVNMSTTHNSVIMRGKAWKMNMDHHRQSIYNNVWTELQIGSPHRMWQSQGDLQEGFQNGVYNTFWNLTSDAPELANWPGIDEHWAEYRNGYYLWGYFVMNLVGTDLVSIPEIGEQMQSPVYDPEDVHLEAIPQSVLWPQNIYEAQKSAYQEGTLF